MALGSSIEWTDSTWNPVRGCTKISPGCKNCYASTFAERFRGVPDHPYGQGFKLKLVPEMLDRPLKWKRPQRIFVNSMSDLFHPDVPDEYIRQVADVMVRANWHTFQVLTKRAARLEMALGTFLSDLSGKSHIWFGVSVEDRQYGVPRIDHLRRSAAATRFLSVEPLLEDLGQINLTGIDWVIAGGESGPRARPMSREWVESVRLQCEQSGVAFFFKQWGGVRKATTGRLLNERTYDELPIIQ